ncbi:MAG: glycosyltransferase family 39 protein [Candidatus Bathyarchaeota archaeon]|nr:glycosyltransferase family 39 protein [Candidatus Bathyarchaeota archaeon]
MREILKCPTSSNHCWDERVDTKNLSALLRCHYQLFGVLTAAFLILVSMGTYTNWDAQLEFEAASSVVHQGFPYVTTGLMINQPPLGFYVDAPVFHLMGLSYLNGIGITSAFGLGCVVLVYVLGAQLYGRKTGLAASALFALVPWHVYISRIFLIDVQCLFFSLLFLNVGILAIKRNSEKLVLLSGLFFGLALLTKLFAMFMLVPLLLIVFFERTRSDFQLTLRKALVFLAPACVLQAAWFGVFAQQNFFGVYFSSDLTHPEHIANPNPLFLPQVVINSTGWFLIASGLFSLALMLVYWRLFADKKSMDLVCLGAIATIAGLDMLLVFVLRLTVPYVSAFKYNYVTLPFYCLLAASIVKKAGVLVNSSETKKLKRIARWVLAGAGVILLFAALFESILFLNEWDGFVAFEVDSEGHYFPFNVYSPMNSDFFLSFHYAALAIIVISILSPYIWRALKKPAGWLRMVLSS